MPQFLMDLGNENKIELITLPKAPVSATVAYNLLEQGVSTYLTPEELKILRKSYDIAAKLHDGQKRRSGEDYIIHPICVTIILANLHMDVDTLVAGMLHDTVEDTEYTLEELEKDFSKTVAILVSGVTKLTKLNLVNDKVEKQAENLRHMFIAMSKDIRVIIIKLADRLHNLRTLEYQTREKQEEKSLETIEIYSPIANRLGISKIKSEMDDLALMYLKPKEYVELRNSVRLRSDGREKFIDEIIESVKEKLTEADIKCDVKGRVKNLFSIYKKIKNKNKKIDEVYDIFAIRILVNDLKDCYATLGIIHEYYTPIPGRFKDYIAMPKPNGYKSLHTTVIGKDGTPFEIQIRTYEMDHVAEYGIAAHWAYKENNGSTGVKDINDLNAVNWLKDILSANEETDTSSEFLSFVKDDLDLFKTKIYCFTPEGDIITLPQGSTPIDFAYMIHSAVGNKMVGAKANGVLVPIDYKIQNGDQLSIITSGNSQGPSRDWLSIVKSPQAKSKIQHWFKKEKRDENIVLGKDLVEKYAKSHKLDLGLLLKTEYIEPCLKKYTAETLDDIYAIIGHGGIKESQFVGKLREEYEKNNLKNISDSDIIGNINQDKKKTDKSGAMTIHGASGLSVHYAKCCNPVPGDEIVGFITRGRGITIHRTDCQNIISLPDIERERLIDITWDNADDAKSSYLVTINVYCKNRKGLIVDVSKVLTENNTDIASIETRNSKDDAITISMSFEINNKQELATIISKIKSVPQVVDVVRV